VAQGKEPEVAMAGAARAQRERERDRDGEDLTMKSCQEKKSEMLTLDRIQRKIRLDARNKRRLDSVS
jgi:hypothetical protein